MVAASAGEAGVWTGAEEGVSAEAGLVSEDEVENEEDDDEEEGKVGDVEEDEEGEEEEEGAEASLVSLF